MKHSLCPTQQYGSTRTGPWISANVQSWPSKRPSALPPSPGTPDFGGSVVPESAGVRVILNIADSSTLEIAVTLSALAGGRQFRSLLRRGPKTDATKTATQMSENVWFLDFALVF